MEAIPKRVQFSADTKLKILSLHPSRDLSRIVNAMLSKVYDEYESITMFTEGTEKVTRNDMTSYVWITEQRYLDECAMYGDKSTKVSLGRFLPMFFENYPMEELELGEKSTRKSNKLCVSCKQPRDTNVYGVFLCKNCLSMNFNINFEEDTE